MRLVDGVALNPAHDAIVLALVPVVIIGATALRLSGACRRADGARSLAI